MFPDIFSSFDPQIMMTSLPIPHQLFWLLNSLVFLPLIPPIWTRPSQMSWLLYTLLSLILSQLLRTRSRQFLGWNTIISSLFILLILFNTISLAPYIFSVTSHLLLTLPFGLTLWLSILLSSILSHPSKFLAMLLPGGAPTWLNPFLVMIESTSISVRPITLSFRLAANMSAGHIVILLIALFAAHALLTSLLTALFLLLPAQMGYILFEVGICFIQSFIFCLLLSLYSDEHA